MNKILVLSLLFLTGMTALYAQTNTDDWTAVTLDDNSSLLLNMTTTSGDTGSFILSRHDKDKVDYYPLTGNWDYKDCELLDPVMTNLNQQVLFIECKDDSTELLDDVVILAILPNSQRSGSITVDVYVEKEPGVAKYNGTQHGVLSQSTVSSGQYSSAMAAALSTKKSSASVTPTTNTDSWFALTLENDKFLNLAFETTSGDSSLFKLSRHDNNKVDYIPAKGGWNYKDCELLDPVMTNLNQQVLFIECKGNSEKLIDDMVMLAILPNTVRSGNMTVDVYVEKEEGVAAYNGAQHGVIGVNLGSNIIVK